MASTYKDYLRKWLNESHEEKESPLSYSEWEKAVYYMEAPSEEEWRELRALYTRLTEISVEINKIRLQLYVNRAHRNMNEENWKVLDAILFRIQSEIWSDDENSFGSYELSEYVPILEAQA